MGISNKKIIISCCVIALVLITLIVAIVIFDPSEQRNTYVLTPEICGFFFTKTPEEFFEEYYPWYSTCEDFRKNAEIDKNGNLILHLTEEQENAHLQFWESFDDIGIEEFKKVPGVEVADDYASYTITGTKEEVKYILAYYHPLTLEFCMKYRQLYSGKDPETITITANLVDSTTNKTVYTATLPQEEIVFDLDELPFS